MLDHPKTLEEARAVRYNRWAGNPKGRVYKEGWCAHEVWGGMLSYQCSRKNGYGPDGLYCKQHAKRLD
jgi:hypothetical protein